MKLSQAVTAYLDYAQFRGCGTHTLKAYRVSLTLFAAKLEHDPTLDEAAGEVMPYLLAYGRGKADATRRESAARLRLFYRWACDHGHARGNPLRDLRLLRVRHQRRVWITRAKVRALMAAIPADHREDVALAALLYFDALRISEALSIRVADVGPAARTARVMRKGGREVKRRLHPQAARAVRRWLAVHPGSAWLFPGRHQEKPLSDNTARARLHRHARRARIPEAVTPHVLRRTSAEVLDERGVPLRAIQDHLDHAHIMTTEIYLRNRPGRAAGYGKYL